MKLRHTDIAPSNVVFSPAGASGGLWSSANHYGYWPNTLINVTTQSDSDRWVVIVDMPPHLRPGDKRKVLKWLRQYEHSIRDSFPDLSVTLACHEPRCILEAKRYPEGARGMADRANDRMNRMFDSLGVYG